MPTRAAAALFGASALALLGIGLWTSSWFPFAGAVGAAAACGLALTEP